MKTMPTGKKIELDEQKSIQIHILQFIDEFCENNNIKYFLTYGSLIGAVRHKGYIPWDDDVDICMLREDYEKFRKLLAHEGNPLYSIVDNSVDSRYPFSFLKVQRNGTIVMEKNMYYSFSGIYVDVFPLDYVPEENELRIKLSRKISLLHDLVGVKIRKRMKRRSVCKTFISDCLFIILKMIPLSSLQRRIDNIINQARRGAKDHVGCFAIGTYIKKEFLDISDFATSLRVPFEGINVMIPGEYDKILRKIYGDYMQLPPVEKRVQRHGLDAYWIR